eukprot:TRINITY_DN10706_c0_g1_i3.p2 TRINITY_DN10706_c0_g1~~TRINITY_DN10706_c0_g1_i3.p2  ORF type:complete len:132 (+),score=33.93 TRINITY_DN10706_c0_g1_i3:137-532(+)
MCIRDSINAEYGEFGEVWMDGFGVASGLLACIGWGLGCGGVAVAICMLVVLPKQQQQSQARIRALSPRERAVEMSQPGRVLSGSVWVYVAMGMVAAGFVVGFGLRLVWGLVGWRMAAAWVGAQHGNPFGHA